MKKFLGHKAKLQQTVLQDTLNLAILALALAPSRDVAGAIIYGRAEVIARRGIAVVV
jgi:hypothetical protein